MTTASSPLLSVRGLRVRFSGMVALDGVSLDVREGEILGLIGPNGAGKTTLIEAISGFLPNAEGEAVFDGKPLRGLRPDQRAARGLARTFQSLELFDDLTVRENLAVARESQTWRGSVLDLFRRGRLPRAAQQAISSILELLEIENHAESMPSQLPNGVRKLVAVGRALAGDARLLLLDEPAAGLETQESLSLGRRLRSVAAAAGTSMLLVDHDMSLVLGICDRIHVLDFGRTIAEGTPEEVRGSPAVVSAYLGEEPGRPPPSGDGSGAAGAGDGAAAQGAES